MTEAVIFDFDGVIADTMQDNLKAWQMAFAPYDIPVAADEYFQLEGMGRHEIALYFINKYKQHIAASAGAIAASKELLYKQHHSFRLFEYITDILELLKRNGIKTGLVTGASRDRILHTLGELKAYFAAIVTVDDVQHGKPDPEPYLKAIDMLACNPAHTLVVENAILGIDAAVAAGCTCLALETTLERSFLGKAQLVFKDHQELLNYFKEII